MLFAVLGGYLLAIFSIFLYKRFPKVTGYGSVAAVICLFIYFFSFITDVASGESYEFSYSWVPSLSINLTFYLDALSLFFVLLITFFGALILLYSIDYMQGMRQVNRFFAYLLIFMSSMIGLVLSGNVILLYIFWELTSISYFLLISYENKKKAARRAALQALLVTNAGGLALLAGLILLMQAAGSFDISDILKSEVGQSANFTAMLLLILFGCFTKSAQFPFHFWLPNAMAAPTPVSAYLHSATMVKAGIFLLFRLHPVLGGGALWLYIIMTVGIITMCLGAFLSFIQSDIKKILAYITISALGMMVAMIGVGTAAALKAAVIYLLIHALYKGALFLIAGNIDHETGTRDINALSGLLRAMPFTGAAAILACLSMAGIPPALGFTGKEKLYESALESPVLHIFLLIAIVLSSAFYVAIAIRLAYGIFIGKRAGNLPQPPKEAHFPMWIGPLLLGVTGILLSFFQNTLFKSLLEQASSIATGSATHLDLALWHGFNMVVVLSILTVISGILFFQFKTKIQSFLMPLNKEYVFTPEGLYDFSLRKLNPLAKWITRWIQSGYLRNYLLAIFSFLILLIVYAYFSNDLLPKQWQANKLIFFQRIYEFIPVILISIGIVTIFQARSRLTILMAMGMIGYGIASIFVFFSAPDVSMTQFLVETLILVIFMLILHRLPKHILLGSEPRRVLHIFISILFGGMVTLILWSIQDVELVSSFKNYYLSHSETLGKGKNVVNVILVDFRAFDTLGEITVVCITALGIVALNSLNTKSKKEK